MVSREKIEAEQVRQRTDVRVALSQVAPPKAPSWPKPETKQLLPIATYLLFLIVLACVRFLLRLRFIHLATDFQAFLGRLASACMVISRAVAMFRGSSMYRIAWMADPALRYNITRIVRLAEPLVLGFISV